jgi:hypothetical protein
MLGVVEAWAIVEKWQRRFAGKRFGDGTKIVREDRGR